MAALRHLTAAAMDDKRHPAELDHSDIDGNPLIEQDAGGQELFYELERLVKRDHEMHFRDGARPYVGT